ncbi:class I SAM-dependent methyltransferase [Lentibacillus sp. N15]|uniref:class I SAM-dependent methyltransferase n=1 Tax=Lentibacillus songyuanensis TaxID=3136161 RepID=UPI0031BA6118
MSKEHWNSSFSDTDYVYGETANKFIQEKNTLIPAHAKIGCFAEGEGRNAVYLARLGYDVTAFDQSDVGLEKTSALAAKNNVTVKTVELDLTQEKVEENQFDAAIMVFGHVPRSDQKFLIDSLIGSVKTGGYAIFEVYSEAQLEYGTGGPPAKDMLYDPKDILDWIRDCKCLHFYYGEAKRHEGKKHSGDCHLIQVVVRK